VFNYGPGGLGWIPIAGDWDGDGITTIGLYDPAHSNFFLRNSNSAGVADLTFGYGPAAAGWLPITGDWNSDYRDSGLVRSLNRHILPQELEYQRDSRYHLQLWTRRNGMDGADGALELTK
jgi:hypothetical protein